MTIYEWVFKCPDIQNQSDVLTLRERLFQSPGIDEIDVDLQSKKVRITTAAQDGGKDVRWRLSEAGFPPEED